MRIGLGMQEVQNQTDKIFQVRRATVGDASLIAEHRASMFLDMGRISQEEHALLKSASRTYLQKAIPEQEYLAWLVESAEQHVVAGGGLILRQLMPRPGHLEGGKEAQILNIYTDPAHRRHGLARLIMSSMMDWCKEQGINRITLHASEFGRPLYESLGFKQTNEMRFEILEVTK